MNFPEIPVHPPPEGLVNMVADYDYGPEFRYAESVGGDYEGTACGEAVDSYVWCQRSTRMVPTWVACRQSCGRRRSGRTSAGT